MNVITSTKFQRFCKWASQPHINRKINTYTPMVQSAFVSSFYIYDIWKSDMPEKNKKNMLLHDILTAGVGIGASVWLTKSIDRFKDNVCKRLENEKTISKIGGVCRGVKILAPIALSSFIMRLALPVGSIYVADYATKHIKKKEG